MNITAAPTEILAVFERVFPIAAGNVSVEFRAYEGSSPVVVDGDALRATIMLVVWDGSGPTRAVRDIKEQECVVCDQRVHELPERLEAGLQALAAVLERVFEDRPEGVDHLMPSDLFFPNVFRLKTARTVEDFTRALAMKSRLDVPTLRGDS